MTFTDPIPFEEAVAFARRKGLLPTRLNSRQLSALSSQLKRRATFSAKMDRLGVLDVLQKNLEKITEGGTDEFGRIRSIPEAKAQLKEAMQRAGILPAPAGTSQVQDFYSDSRRQLMVETNVLDTLNFGRWKATQDPIALDINPAWELVRMIEPRGQPRDWEQRWQDAGGEIIDGRMVALKNDPIWQALGDGIGGYEDTLGNPWPPFAFNSGMNVIDVTREDAVALGLLGEDDAVEPSDEHDLNESLEASSERFDEEIQAALADDDSLELVDGVLRLANRRAVVRNRLGGLLALMNAGTSEGARKGWETRRLGMQTAIDSVLDGKTKRADYADVSDAEAAKIRAATGRDVRGYKHTLDQDTIRHIEKRHGAGREQRPDQEPITKADYAKIPDIITSPDKIEAGRSSRGLPTIKYTKKIGSDHMFVEEEWTAQRRLVAKTFWKKKAALGNRATTSTREAGVVQTSETSRAYLKHDSTRGRLQALCSALREAA
jgi:hypothetical protein